MIDFEDYRHSGVSIFGLGLLHPNNTENVISDLKSSLFVSINISNGLINN